MIYEMYTWVITLNRVVEGHTLLLIIARCDGLVIISDLLSLTVEVNEGLAPILRHCYWCYLKDSMAHMKIMGVINFLFVNFLTIVPLLVIINALRHFVLIISSVSMNVIMMTQDVCLMRSCPLSLSVTLPNFHSKTMGYKLTLHCFYLL